MKAIVVLGAAVWADGPSPTLRRRSLHAAAVWQRGGHDAVIACGGLGRHPPSEAAVIAGLLTAAGVPPEVIQQEDRSTTTLENLHNARTILRQMGCDQITIVTDRTHGPRARLVARMLGLRARIDAPPLRGGNPRTQARQFVRESFALPAYTVRLWVRRLRGKL